MAEKQIPIKNISGLRTGRSEGLTGHFLRENAHLVNTHCSAHRVALQAATNIPAMKYFQGILEALFHHLKKSPAKSDKLEAVQKLLNEPELEG